MHGLLRRRRATAPRPRLRPGLPRGGANADARGRSAPARREAARRRRDRAGGRQHAHLRDPPGQLALRRAAERRRRRRRLGAELVFPGLRPGERLARTDAACPRARRSQARDGTALAQGDTADVRLGPRPPRSPAPWGPPRPTRRRLEAQRRARPRPVGLTGLEREFDDAAAGTPGGSCSREARAGRQRPRGRGSTVRRRSTRASRGRRRGAGRALRRIAVVRPHTGEVLALAGSPTPPPAARLHVQDRHARRRARGGVAKRAGHFPSQPSATLEGVELENANGESCGGSLEASFAESCNSVFAPLGAKLGAARLVAAAERFGFNEEPGSPARRARRSRRRERSATTWRSGRPRSARARCWPRRSDGRRSRRRSASTACGRCRR